MIPITSPLTGSILKHGPAAPLLPLIRARHAACAALRWRPWDLFHFAASMGSVMIHLDQIRLPESAAH